jgi:hypothetical protein
VKYLGGKPEGNKGLESLWVRLDGDIKLGVKVSDDKV